MQHSITTRRITGLALAALALTSPLATQPAQAGFFDKIVGKIKDKAKEKFQEYTNPQFLAGKLAERLGKNVPNAPAPGFATPPVVAAPAPAPAPAPMVRADAFGNGRRSLAVSSRSNGSAGTDCVSRHANSIPSLKGRSSSVDCGPRSAAPAHQRPGYPFFSGTNPVVDSAPDARTSERELAMRLIALAERLLGRTYAVGGIRAAEAAHEAYEDGMVEGLIMPLAAKRRSIAAFRKATRLDKGALRARSIHRMNRLGGEAELRRELAGDDEGARPEGPSADGAAEIIYSKLERAAREAALQAAVVTFRKARQVGMAAARKKIAEYREKLSLETRRKYAAAYKNALKVATSGAAARKLADEALEAAKATSAEKLDEFQAKVEAEALEQARAEAWDAAEEAYAKEEKSAFEVAVDIDELMNTGKKDQDGELTGGAEQRVRVAAGEAATKFQAAAKETSGIFGLGFQGVPTE